MSALFESVSVLLLIFLASKSTIAAPFAEPDTTDIEYYPLVDATGCYYNFQHYDEGDRIITNEPCLNCTCHNKMLMCYLRVCPFTKAIGQDCKIEKKVDQCCPVITCPEVPVQLLPSTTESSTAVGHPDTYGCSIDKLFYSDGARVPSHPNKPCELCYCIRNKTACVMQQCTLQVEGCQPVFQEGICCPVRYDCEHSDGKTTHLETTVPTLITTTAFIPTTTLQAPANCIFNNDLFADGALIRTEKPCEHCYCMKGDIVCAVQRCSPTPLDKVNCTALLPKEGQCCPDTYDCENIIEEELTTIYPTTIQPEQDYQKVEVKPESELPTQTKDEEKLIAENATPSVSEPTLVTEAPKEGSQPTTIKSLQNADNDVETDDNDISKQQEIENPSESEYPAYSHNKHQPRDSTTTEFFDYSTVVTTPDYTTKLSHKELQTQEDLTTSTKQHILTTTVEPSEDKTELFVTRATTNRQNDKFAETKLTETSTNTPLTSKVFEQQTEVLEEQVTTKLSITDKELLETNDVSTLRPFEDDSVITESNTLADNVEFDVTTEPSNLYLTEKSVNDKTTTHTKEPTSDNFITEHEINVSEKYTTVSQSSEIIKENELFTESTTIAEPSSKNFTNLLPTSTEKLEEHSSATDIVPEEAIPTTIKSFEHDDDKHSETASATLEQEQQTIVSLDHTSDDSRTPDQNDMLDKKASEATVKATEPSIFNDFTTKALDVFSESTERAQSDKQTFEPSKPTLNPDTAEYFTTEKLDNVNKIIEPVQSDKQSSESNFSEPTTTQPIEGLTESEPNNVEGQLSIYDLIHHDNKSEIKPEQTASHTILNQESTTFKTIYQTTGFSETEDEHTTVKLGEDSAIVEQDQIATVASVDANVKLEQTTDQSKLEAIPIKPTEQQTEKIEAIPVEPVEQQTEKVEAIPVEPTEQQTEKIEATPVEPVEQQTEKVEAISVESLEHQTDKIETKPVEPTEQPAEKLETLPVEPTEQQTEKIEAIPAEPTEEQTEKSEAIPVEPTEQQTEKIEAIPVEPTEQQTEKIETMPVEPTEQQTEKSETIPVEPTEQQTEKIEAIPAEPTEEQTQKSETIPVEPTEQQTEKIEAIPAETTEKQTEKSEAIPVEPTEQQTEKVKTTPVEQTEQSTEKLETIPVKPTEQQTEKIEAIPIEPTEQQTVKIETIPVEPTEQQTEKSGTIPVEPSEQQAEEITTISVEPTEQQTDKIDTKPVEPIEQQTEKLETIPIETTEQQTEKIFTVLPEKAEDVSSLENSITKLSASTDKYEIDTNAPITQKSTTKTILDEKHKTFETTTITQLPEEIIKEDITQATLQKDDQIKESHEATTLNIELDSSKTITTTEKYKTNEFKTSDMPKDSTETPFIEYITTAKNSQSTVISSEKDMQAIETDNLQDHTEQTGADVTKSQSQADVSTELPNLSVDQEKEYGIPGEGSCLVDGQTYRNNSKVATINHCQISCKCVSSIIQCETVTCKAPPTNFQYCMPLYQGPDSCCPTYSCSVPGVTSMESDSHKIETTTIKEISSTTEIYEKIAPSSEVTTKSHSTDGQFVTLQPTDLQDKTTVEEHVTKTSKSDNLDVTEPTTSSILTYPLDKNHDEDKYDNNIEKDGEIKKDHELQQHTDVKENNFETTKKPEDKIIAATQYFDEKEEEHTRNEYLETTVVPIKVSTAVVTQLDAEKEKPEEPQTTTYFDEYSTEKIVDYTKLPTIAENLGSEDQNKAAESITTEKTLESFTKHFETETESIIAEILDSNDQKKVAESITTEKTVESYTKHLETETKSTSAENVASEDQNKIVGGITTEKIAESSTKHLESQTKPFEHFTSNVIDTENEIEVTHKDSTEVYATDIEKITGYSLSTESIVTAKVDSEVEHFTEITATSVDLHLNDVEKTSSSESASTTTESIRDTNKAEKTSEDLLTSAISEVTKPEIILPVTETTTNLHVKDIEKTTKDYLSTESAEEDKQNNQTENPANVDVTTVNDVSKDVQHSTELHPDLKLEQEKTTLKYSEENEVNQNNKITTIVNSIVEKVENLEPEKEETLKTTPHELVSSTVYNVPTEQTTVLNSLAQNTSISNELETSHISDTTLHPKPTVVEETTAYNLLDKNNVSSLETTSLNVETNKDFTTSTDSSLSSSTQYSDKKTEETRPASESNELVPEITEKYTIAAESVSKNVFEFTTLHPEILRPLEESSEKTHDFEAIETTTNIIENVSRDESVQPHEFESEKQQTTVEEISVTEENKNEIMLTKDEVSNSQITTSRYEKVDESLLTTVKSEKTETTQKPLNLSKDNDTKETTIVELQPTEESITQGVEINKLFTETTAKLEKVGTTETPFNLSKNNNTIDTTIVELHSTEVPIVQTLEPEVHTTEHVSIVQETLRPIQSSENINDDTKQKTTTQAVVDVTFTVTDKNLKDEYAEGSGSTEANPELTYTVEHELSSTKDSIKEIQEIPPQSSTALNEISSNEDITTAGAIDKIVITTTQKSTSQEENIIPTEDVKLNSETTTINVQDVGTPNKNILSSSTETENLEVTTVADKKQSEITESVLPTLNEINKNNLTTSGESETTEASTPAVKLSSTTDKSLESEITINPVNRVTDYVLTTSKVSETSSESNVTLRPDLEDQKPIKETEHELPTNASKTPEEAFASSTFSFSSTEKLPELYTSGPSEELSTRKPIPGELSTSGPPVSFTTTTQTTKPDVDEDYHSQTEDDYSEEDQNAFGPGTCRYGGKVFVSAQQIPRDDPCDFCFCFRGDIICLQQSCPPPIPHCHEEPIRGFCCPRYECPVSMATSLNLTTTTTTTTTTLPPHFLSHAYKGRAHRSGCQVQNKTYRVGESIKSASGPCLHCICGGNGQMKCDPKPCSPEPMLRQMIAAAEKSRTRRR